MRREDRQDAVGLAQVEAPEHDRGGPVQAWRWHPPSLPCARRCAPAQPPPDATHPIEARGRIHHRRRCGRVPRTGASMSRGGPAVRARAGTLPPPFDAPVSPPVLLRAYRRDQGSPRTCLALPSASMSADPSERAQADQLRAGRGRYGPWRAPLCSQQHCREYEGPLACPTEGGPWPSGHGPEPASLPAPSMIQAQGRPRRSRR